MKSADNIKNLFKNSRITVGQHVDKKILDKAASALPQQATQPDRSTWSIIMHSKITKFSGIAAAIIIIAVLTGIYQLTGSIDGASVAFAEVLEHINSFSYKFDLTTVTDKNASKTVQAMVLEPGKMRVDATVGLGKISTIIDVAEGKSTILFHQFKTAQIQEMPTMVKDYGAESFLFLCTKSIENLWDMQDGTEEPLGKKEIDGRTAIGFKVMQKGQYFRSGATLWADAKTATPILVEMTMSPLGDSPESMVFIMNNFDLDVQLDADLFTLKTPPGYTLAYQNSLDELDKKNEFSDQAKKIVQALEIWSQGKKTQAIETLLVIDWTQPIKFSGEPYLFSMTEKELVSLKPNDQQKVMADVMTLSTTIKKITKELLSLGQTAMSVQEYKEAEHYYQTALQFGKLLTRDSDAILIGRLVGIAVEKITLDEMIILYTQTNQQEKLQVAQKELQVMKTEQDKIKDKARGL